MERILGFAPFDLHNSGQKILTSPEVGEGPSPTKALLFKDGSVSVISGKSSSLSRNGFKPFENTHFNTQFALAITQALASFHAFLRAKGIRKLQRNSAKSEGKFAESMEEMKPQREDVEFNLGQGCTLSDSDSDAHEIDNWTNQITQSSLVSSNLSILCSQFEQERISSRIINKLESLQTDMPTLTQFLQFASAMQNETKLQSVGPICMCDVWVPQEEEEDGQTLVIRLRGGPNIQAPPMRDITWIWLTLLRPEVLQDRYMELCELYCSSYNNTLQRQNSKLMDEVTLFEVMRDLGDSFLHGFLTLVHKFTVSGVWSLDRQLHTPEGIQSIADSIAFLVDNGIIGSLFIA